MSSNTITKVMKYTVKLDKNTSFDFLFSACNESTAICRDAIRTRVHIDYLSREFKNIHGEFPKPIEFLGGKYKSIDGWIYHELSSKCSVLSGDCINATIRKALESYSYKNIPNFKSNQPIIIPHLRIVSSEENHYCIECTLFSNSYKKDNNIQGNVRLRLMPQTASEKTILQRVWSNEYQIGRSELIYQKSGKKIGWVLALTYKFERSTTETNLPTKRLGVYMSESVAIYASSPDESGTFVIDGSDIPIFAHRIEAIRQQKQHQARNCGNGRRGHGTKTRVNAIYNAQHIIDNYRSTKNDIYSHDLVEYAHAHNFTDIYIEDLTGTKANNAFPRRMQHWTYYDLQQKIKFKADIYGIRVHIVKGDFAIKCSKCGYTHLNNLERGVVDRFRCYECGYDTSINYNASRNIAVAEEKEAKNKKKENIKVRTTSDH